MRVECLGIRRSWLGLLLERMHRGEELRCNRQGGQRLHDHLTGLAYYWLLCYDSRLLATISAEDMSLVRRWAICIDRGTDKHQFSWGSELVVNAQLCKV